MLIILSIINYSYLHNFVTICAWIKFSYYTFIIGIALLFLVELLVCNNLGFMKLKVLVLTICAKIDTRNFL